MGDNNPQAPNVTASEVRDISSYLLASKYGATAFVGFAPENPSTRLKNARGFVLQEQILDGGTLKYFSKNKIYRKTRDSEGKKLYRDVTGTFLFSKLVTPKAYLFLTKDPGEFVNDGLQRLLYRSRTIVTRLHLTSGEMRDIVSDLLVETSGRVVVRRSIVRNKRQETTVSYETESLDELYSKAASDNAHVHSFAFRLYERKAGNLILNAGLNREGRFTFYAGNLKTFFTELIEHACQLFKKKDQLVQDRVHTQGSNKISPIRIIFDEFVFEAKDGIRAFLRTLGNIPHGEFTIFHRNPYLHVTFFDFFDGSEFDLFIESPAVVVVVPQSHASPPSLLRLCQKICENFQEGVIVEDDSSIGASDK
jgi:hypothetical protein